MARLALHLQAAEDFDLPTILLLLPKYWDYRHVSHCLTAFLYNCSHEHMFYFLLDKYLGVELLRKTARICYDFVLFYLDSSCSLACLLECAQFHFSTSVLFRNPCLGNDTTHSGLALPTSINLIKTTPTLDIPYQNLLQVILSCVKLTIKDDHHIWNVYFGA